MGDLSYLSSPFPSPFLYKSVVDLFNERADENPNKELFIHRLPNGTRRTITYIELKHKAERTAKYLVSKGVRPGDSVGIFGPNSMEWIVGELAILMAGAVSMHVVKPPGPFRKTYELLEFLNCKAVLLDTDDDQMYIAGLLEFMKSNRADEKAVGLEKSAITLLMKIEDADLPNVQDVSVDETAAAWELPTTIYPESTAIIFMSSGSTGHPKMAEHSHFALVNVSSASLLSRGLDERGGVFFNDRPFCWIGGSPVYALTQGDTRVYRDGRVTVKDGSGIMDLWKIIVEEKCTNALLLPLSIIDILQKKEEILKTNYRLKAVFTGGQMIGRKTTEILGVVTERFYMLYGSTELGIQTHCALDPNLVVGRLGTLSPGLQVKIVGDDGNTVIRGQIGEMYIKCPWMFTGYRNPTEDNKKALVNGWMNSGDIGLITKGNDLVIKGKAENVIKRGTLKVLTGDVEECISKVPGVKEVVVVSVPDVRLYEDVCACVMLDKNVNVQMSNIEDYCKETLGDNIIGDAPTFYLEVDSLPRLNTGKPDKPRIKQHALDRLNIKPR